MNTDTLIWIALTILFYVNGVFLIEGISAWVTQRRRDAALEKWLDNKAE